MSNRNGSARMYPHVATRVFDTPLMIHPAKLDAVLSVLSPRMGFELPPTQAEASEYETHYSEDGYRVSGNVAIIPVVGTTIHRYDWLSEASGFCSYEKIGLMLQRALEDETIDHIVFDVDSFGGEVAGLFDLCEKIYGSRSIKPSTAIVNDHAASAGYAIASCATRVIMPASGWLGSIGVVMTHVDRSKQLEMMGQAVTFIFEGKHKVDGNSAEPLPKEVKKDLQEHCSKVYDMFTALVARNRGITQDAARATEAQMYLGEDAVALGLVDSIGTFGETLKTLGIPEDENPRPNPPQEENPMSDKSKAEGDSPTAEDVNKARNEGHQAGAKASQDRIAGILQSEAAKGRTKLASHLAFNTQMSQEDAVATLSASALESAEPEPKNQKAHKTALEVAMEREGGGAGIGAEAGGEEELSTEGQVNATVDMILQNAGMKKNG